MKDDTLNNAPALTEEELQERKKMRKAAFIKMLAMVIFCICVMIFGSVAWFTSNKENAASGMGVRVGTLPFDIMVQGDKGYLDDALPLPTGDNGYARPLENETVLSTADGKQKIEWLVTKDYQAKNYYDSENSNFNVEDDIGIRPGDSGTLHFWIMPKSQSALTFTFNLKVTPYKKQFPMKEDGVTPDYDTNPSPIALTDSASDDALMNFVDSHILFFRYHGDDPDDESNTKYSKLIDDEITETITFTDEDNDGVLDPYEVKIHWIWPETLGEAVLADSANRVAVCKTIDGNNELLNKLNQNPGGFLEGYSFPEDVTALTQQNIIDQYTVLSIRYNNADQEIGDNIMYLMTEMTVDLANENENE